jgi:hypothetical protein
VQWVFKNLFASFCVPRLLHWVGFWAEKGASHDVRKELHWGVDNAAVWEEEEEETETRNAG